MIKAGIIGSTGYAGEQLAWFLYKHPNVDVEFYSSHKYAYMTYSEIYSNFYSYIDDICVDMETAISKLSDINVLFIAMPHGKSFEITQKALALGVKVIDLGADYRLKSKDVYEKWYKVKHESEGLLKDAVYGLCELNREAIKRCNLLANPGCYPTATILALTPMLNSDMIDTSSIIVDAKSGVSGAGRAANVASLYTECNESIKAYAVTTHRHTPEIEQELSKASGNDVTICFTPHLVPMNRGILSTCYAKLTKDITEQDIISLYRNFYKDEFFVKIIDGLPETRWVRGSNICHIGIRVDKRTNRVIIISAIDNLVKGSAGQAVQNMNIMFGIPETTGLEIIAMAP
ncbi:N-acetyl-gamma-glutamyl-phosphate reductase [Clostridium estertheticum]|uniref:N-acetyl-gamma-glutamyl-phosphate reductase n=1 Tax=Clostridium estertheticum TaxID=238834 RepID=UPI001C0D1CF4|nr:N-acetyl-gamma-glutamyl-phosphate reductase [Clostridium estertheticum]MBU3213575.1 N-acetyl-gamma-glutamyl-phosphate reductase [Clostridium estertheticum]WAG53468.1 N-acetyl-gamma-glutamyl-phosphate reductase [Clostridium estertheticum]